MEIIELILIHHAINWFIAHCDRPSQQTHICHTSEIFIYKTWQLYTTLCWSVPKIQIKYDEVGAGKVTIYMITDGKLFA